MKLFTVILSQQGIKKKKKVPKSTVVIVINYVDCEGSS